MKIKKSLSWQDVIGTLILVVIVIIPLILIIKPFSALNLKGYNDITIVYYSPKSKQEHTVKITDQQQISQLQNIKCEDGYATACGYGTIKLIYKKGDKSIILYPAMDGHQVIKQDNDRYYWVSFNWQNNLNQILIQNNMPIYDDLYWKMPE